MPIIHMRLVIIYKTDQQFLILNDIVVIPSASKNLLSIQRLCSENHVIIRFDAQKVEIKERESGRIILEGSSRDGILYELLLCRASGGFVLLVEKAS